MSIQIDEIAKNAFPRVNPNPAISRSRTPNQESTTTQAAQPVFSLPETPSDTPVSAAAGKDPANNHANTLASNRLLDALAVAEQINKTKNTILERPSAAAMAVANKLPITNLLDILK